MAYTEGAGLGGMGLMGLIAQHGYAAVALIMFVAAAGLPLPTAIVLLLAGSAAAGGEMAFGLISLLAWGAALAGDVLLYFGGRYTGWWLLAGMCRVSINPESCIFTSSAYFYRRGANTLLVAKWVPGLAAMAAPLAGSLNMRFARFLRLDAAGTALYVLPWVAAGFLFHRLIGELVARMEQLGHMMLLLGLLLLAIYALYVVAVSLGARKYNAIEKISAASLHRRLQEIDPDRLVVIADVRSHNYYDPGMQRIKNSIRVEPGRLKEELVALREFMAPECEIYLYCSCLRDTTSKRVAHALKQENCNTRVIEGGLKAWVKAGGELENVPAGDVQHLPRFE